MKASFGSAGSPQAPAAGTFLRSAGTWPSYFRTGYGTGTGTSTSYRITRPHVSWCMPP